MGVALAWDCDHASQIPCLYSRGLTMPAPPRSQMRTGRKPARTKGCGQAVERASYSLEDSGHGTYGGVNPAQRLTLEFDGQEARLSHPDGSVSFRLTGYGYGDRLQKAGARQTNRHRQPCGVPARRSHRMVLQRIARPGARVFTLGSPPGTNREDEPLVIASA